MRGLASEGADALTESMDSKPDLQNGSSRAHDGNMRLTRRLTANTSLHIT